MSAPVVILVRPQMAENIGMAARAMANFGLSRMRLVAPRDGWPQKTRMKKGAHQAASGATHILDGAQLFSSVEEAVADLTYVLATTARERGQAKPVLTPQGAMHEILEHPGAGEGVGILFGPERTGLENDEVSLADAVLTFPINPAFASLNLAQAVLLVGYEWFKTAQGGQAPFAMPSQTGPARRETLFSFFAFAEKELDRVRFFWPPDRRATMVRNFRNIFHRLALTEQDVRTLRGALDALVTGGKPERMAKPHPGERPAHDRESDKGT
ncbi:MAG TPA: RNA methyltransferase [Beijerinckiaceae bacterium]|nr:RNA methyltransferase [Beijerinckiaceae bacterium]